MEEPKLHVLVVDDEANIRKTVSVCLETEGHRVTAVGNAKDALAEADRQVFDLAFAISVSGPRAARSHSGAPGRMPLAQDRVITAYASVDTAVEAMRRGAVDYIRSRSNQTSCCW